MAEPQSFPYETRLNIYYQPLQVIEEKALADACMYKWYNQTLCQVNASVVRFSVSSRSRRIRSFRFDRFRRQSISWPVRRVG